MGKILFITAYIPRESNAGAAYTKQLLEELANKHVIDLIFFRSDKKLVYNPSHPNINIVGVYNVSTWSRIVGFICKPWLFPFFTCRFSPLILKRLKNRIRKNGYDFVYFDFSQSFIYSYYLEHPNKILMSHDVIAQKYTRTRKYLLPWVIRTEHNLLKKGNAIFTFSPKDSGIIKDLYGIDSQDTTFFINKNVKEAAPTESNNSFIFFGAWKRIENLESLEWFFDNVYGHLRCKSSFVIIGSGLADNMLNRIKSLQNVHYMGYVENPYPLIANAKAMIAPLHKGAGVKVKCIEAMACGTMVIGTSVAFEGISPIYSKLMIKAETTEEFINSIGACEQTIDEKKKNKEWFISSYDKKSILKYINSVK